MEYIELAATGQSMSEICIPLAYGGDVLPALPSLGRPALSCLLGVLRALQMAVHSVILTEVANLNRVFQYIQYPHNMFCIAFAKINMEVLHICRARSPGSVLSS